MPSDQSRRSSHIYIDGMSPQEIIDLSDEHLAALIAVGPIVFRAGSADVLGQVKLGTDTLIIELAQIDGGGEGVLLSLSLVAEAFARQRGIGAIEWIVHAVNCAAPNLKLRRVLEKRGFVVRNLSGIGAAYHLRQDTPGLASSATRR